MRGCSFWLLVLFGFLLISIAKHGVIGASTTTPPTSATDAKSDSPTQSSTQSPASPPQQSASESSTQPPAQSPASPTQQSASESSTQPPAQSPTSPTQQSASESSTQPPAQSPASPTQQPSSELPILPQQSTTQSPTTEFKGIPIVSEAVAIEDNTTAQTTTVLSEIAVPVSENDTSSTVANNVTTEMPVTNATDSFNSTAESTNTTWTRVFSITQTSIPTLENTTAEVKPDDVTTGSNETIAPTTTVGVQTTTPKPAPVAKPDFVVKDGDGNPCLLASLNISTRILYKVQEGLVKEVYETISSPENASFSGTCGTNTSVLSITWKNNTFSLILTFVLTEGIQSMEDELAMAVGENAELSSWSVRKLSLSYDTSNSDVFPGADQPKMDNLTLSGLALFATPLGQAYMCSSPGTVDVDLSQDVNLRFNSVQLMPFGVTSNQFSNDTSECTGAGGPVPAQEGSYVVPFIVACVLAAVVVLIIIGYIINRYVTRHLRQAEYKQMP